MPGGLIFRKLDHEHQGRSHSQILSSVINAASPGGRS